LNAVAPFYLIHMRTARRRTATPRRARAN
jgi:hypothetical protein